MASDRIHDPELLDALDAIDPQPISTTAHRVTWSSRDPLAGGTGGGRWHPPNSFEALYTSLEEDGALAEIYHHLSKAPVKSSSSMKVHALTISVEHALIFPNLDSLGDLGVTKDAFLKGEYERTRDIGAAARFLDIEAIIVPSRRWSCSNMVLFLDRIKERELLRVTDTSEVNWPAWRERSELVASRSNEVAKKVLRNADV